MEQLVLHGQKGGSEGARQPFEARNNLLSKSFAKVLLAIGEGEFSGTPTGRDIFLDGTPLISPNGVENFGGVKWEFRPGRTDQTHIAGMPEVASEYGIQLALDSDTPWTRAVSNSQLDAIRVTLAWPALFEQKENGDIVGYNIEYVIDVATDGGAYVEQGRWDTGNGKTNVEYNRTHRINLPKPGSSWMLRVRRITPNKRTSKFQDIMSVKSYAEVIDAKLRYPNTALLYVEFDAETFGGSSIPKVSVRTQGRSVRVPNNYDPVTRTYSGIWNGTFKWAYTNNPAWVFYDLVTNERFGLGSRIRPEMVDKWTLYQVAQYCDVLVPDGMGGQEPRYTCNIYIQARREAWQVLRDVVNIFNGMLFWSGTQMVASADMPVATNSVRTYGRSNVVDGKFTYGSTSEKTIATSALVSYDDPNNHYETAVEAVNDLNLVQRYKTWNQAELSALGCTSRGQAQRKGKYTMLTNSLNRLVTFKLGMEGYLPRPGQVFGVADQVLAGANFSGRIHGGTTTVVTLDRVANAVPGDILYINRTDGVTGEGRTIKDVNGVNITVTAAYSEEPQSELGWYVEKTKLKSQLFRCTKISWDEQNAQFEVTGVQYEDSKFAAVDTGARLEARPITVVPAVVQVPPTDIQLSTYSFVEQGLSITTLSVSWLAAPGAMNYEAQWRKDGGDWINVGRTAGQGFEVRGIYKGAYQARVRAINTFGTTSLWLTSDNKQLNGKDGVPPTVTQLTTESLLFGIKLRWDFPEGAEDTSRTELWYNTANDLASATKLADLAYPQNDYVMQGLRAGQVFYFWSRLVDRSDNQGPFYPVKNGVVGQSSSDAGAILDQIADSITKSQLGQELLTDINRITDNSPGSVNDRINTTKGELNQQITDVSTTITNVQNTVSDVKGQVNKLTNDLDAQLSGIRTSVSDVNTNLTTQINTAKTNLQTSINAVDARNILPWKTTQAYTTGQMVQYTNSKLYRAKQAVPAGTVPTNTTYWSDVGDIVATADGLAARVSTTETSVTNIDGRVTAQASKIDGIQSQINGKADATAVTNLTTRVFNAEGTIQSQGDAITGLQNTVTGKADATALTNLTTRVKDAEGKITSSSDAITSLTNTVSKKADASAVTNLTNRVSDVEGTVTSQGTAITGLTNTVKGKADVSAVNGLSTRVDTTERTITSQGQSLLNINSTLGSALDNSPTKVYQSVFSDISADQWVATNSGTGAVASFGTPAGITRGAALILDGGSGNKTWWGASTRRIRFDPTRLYKLTIRVQQVSMGTGSPGIYAGIDCYAEDGKLRISTQGTSSVGSSHYVLMSNRKLAQGEWATAEVYVKGHTVGSEGGAAGAGTVTDPKRLKTGTAWFSPMMIAGYDSIGGQVVVDYFDVEDATAQVQIDANASATQALTTRADNIEGTLTSQGSAITTLNNTLTSVGGENMLINPSFEVEGPTAGLAAGWRMGSGLPAASRLLSLVPSTLDPKGKAQRVDAKGLTGSTYVDIAMPFENCVSIAPGQFVTMSAYVRGTATLVHELYLQYKRANGSTIGTHGPLRTVMDGGWTRVVFTGSPAPAETVSVDPLYRIRGPLSGTATDGFYEIDRAQVEFSPVVTGWSDNTQQVKLDAAANSSATSALDSRVSKAEGTITSQGNSITTLNNSVAVLGASGINLVPAEYSVFAKDLPATMYSNGGVTLSTVADASTFKGYALKAVNSNVDSHTFGLNPAFTAAGCNMSFKRGKYLVSFYAKSDTAGHMVGAYVRALLADGTSFKTSNAPTFALTTSWARYYGIIDLTDAAYTGTQMQLAIQSNRSGVANRVTYYDRFMLEAVANNITEPSVFTTGDSYDVSQANSNATTALTSRVDKAEGNLESVAGNVTNLSNIIAGKADASALSALTNRVKQTEGGLNTQSDQITQLDNSLGDAGAENLAYNPTFVRGTATVPEGWQIEGGATNNPSMVQSWLNSSERAFRVAVTGVTSGSPYLSLRSFNDASGRIKLAGGQVVTASIYARRMADAGLLQMRIWLQFTTAAGTVLSSASSVPTTLDTVGSRFTVTATAHPDAVQAIVFYRIHGPSGTGINGTVEMARPQVEYGSRASGWHDNGQVLASDISATSTALGSLSSTVTQQGKDVTSQGNSIISLNNTVAGINGSVNLLPAEYSSFSSTPPAMNLQNGLVATTEADSSTVGNYKLKLATALTNTVAYFYLGATGSDWNLKLKPNRNYILSFWVQADTAKQMSLRVRYPSTSGSVVETELALLSVPTTMTRVSAVMKMPSNLIDNACIVFYQTKTAQACTHYYDGFMLEEQVGTGTEPSTYSTGNSARQTQAQATALSTLTNRVTKTEDTIISQGNSITNLNNTVAGKADSSALGALSTRVGVTEKSIESQGSSVTQLQNQVGGISGTGSNLLSDEYSWLTSTTLPQLNGSGASWAGVAVPGSASGFGIKMTASSNSNGTFVMLCPTNNAAGYNIPVEPGYYLVSFYASTPSTASVRIRMFASGISVYSATQAVNSTRTRYSLLVNMGTTSATVAVIFYFNMNSVSGQEVTIDSVMVEKQVGPGSTASPFVAGPSARSVTTQGSTISAQGSALTALTNRVTSAENTLTSASSAITDLQNSIGTAGAFDPAPDCTWNFDGSGTEGWTAAGANLTSGASTITITSTGNDPQLQSPSASMNVNGALYDRVRAKITRKAGAASDWDGQLFYNTASHGWVNGYRGMAPNPNLAVGQSAVVEWDMTSLAAGGNDWINSTILRMRLDLGATSGGSFEIDWIAVGRSAPSASARAVSSLATTVSQQGDLISSQATSINGLSTTVGGHTTSIQQVSTVATNTNNALNAQYSVKVMTMNNGTKVAAGFGLGLSNETGVTQSTFVVSADRFAVLNSSLSGTVTSPFSVINGQVFINDAFINKATITNGIIGQALSSSARTTWDGQPVMVCNFNTGDITLRHGTRNATYTVLNRDGITVVVDGVIRVRMGVW